MARFIFTFVFLTAMVVVHCQSQRQFQRRPATPTNNNLNYNRRETNSLQTPTYEPSASCPEKNGRFPVASQCDAYVECVDGIPEQKLCPDGLLFNPNARFNYPCGYPIDIDCASRRNIQPAQSNEECPHKYGYFKIGDAQNCGEFVNCADGKAYKFQCPEGLAFNSDTYKCDWPDQVSDCDAEAYLGFRCPAHNPSTFPVAANKFFRSPVDCQRYFFCYDGKPRLQNCGEGRAFNDLTNSCDGIENVTGCAFSQQINNNSPSFNARNVRQPVKLPLRSIVVV